METLEFPNSTKNIKIISSKWIHLNSNVFERTRRPAWRRIQSHRQVGRPSRQRNRTSMTLRTNASARSGLMFLLSFWVVFMVCYTELSKASWVMLVVLSWVMLSKSLNFMIQGRWKVIAAMHKLTTRIMVPPTNICTIASLYWSIGSPVIFPWDGSFEASGWWYPFECYKK